MVFNLKLSLEEMAMIKAAILLWNKDDIYLVSKLIVLKRYERGLKWEEIETTLLEKVKQLCVPENCKEKISGFVRPIGLEILRLIEYHVDLFTVGDNINYLIYRIVPKRERIEATIIPDKIFWTTQGTVDRKKTTEMMTKQDNLDIRNRYILACSYCLEKEIVELWNRMPEQYRQHFYSKEGPKHVRQQYLIVYWTYTLLGEKARLNEMLQGYHSAYHRLAEDAVDFVNLEAAKFFFPKLTDSERTENLMEFRTSMEHRRKRSASMWRFLLLQLEKDQKIEMTLDCLRRLLFSFLKWPWQSVFMEVVKRIGDGITEYLSYAILNEIADLVRHGYTDYSYQELFGEYWLYISREHKRNVISEIMHDPKLLRTLLMVKDMENFYLILEEATAEECINIFCIVKPSINYKTPFMNFIGESFLPMDFVQFVYEFKLRILHRRSEEEIQRERQAWESFF